jgi:hypothetical protein
LAKPLKTLAEPSSQKPRKTVQAAAPAGAKSGLTRTKANQDCLRSVATSNAVTGQVVNNNMKSTPRMT